MFFQLHNFSTLEHHYTLERQSCPPHTIWVQWLAHSLSMTIIKADGDDDIYLSRFKDLGRGGDDGNIIPLQHTQQKILAKV